MERRFAVIAERRIAVGATNLNEDGGIKIRIAAEKPEGVPEEDWLPISRKDENMDNVLRICVPDSEKMKFWTAPKAIMVK